MLYVVCKNSKWRCRVITALPMVFGNIIAKKGGILDDPILNKKDPYYVFDQRVKGFSSQGLNPTFAIRARKRSFLGIQRLETLDFTGVDFQNAL